MSMCMCVYDCRGYADGTIEARGEGRDLRAPNTSASPPIKLQNVPEEVACGEKLRKVAVTLRA